MGEIPDKRPLGVCNLVAVLTAVGYTNDGHHFIIISSARLALRLRSPPCRAGCHAGACSRPCGYAS